MIQVLHLHVLVNITDLIQSLGIRYLLSQNSCYCLSDLMCSIFFMSLWTDIFLLADLQLCLYFCVLLHTALYWLIFQHLLHILPHSGHCLSGHVIPHYLHFTIILFSFTDFLYSLFLFWLNLCLSLFTESKVLVSLMFSNMLSMTFVLPPSGSTLKLVYCLHHWYL